MFTRVYGRFGSLSPAGQGVRAVHRSLCEKWKGGDTVEFFGLLRGSLPADRAHVKSTSRCHRRYPL